MKKRISFTTQGRRSDIGNCIVDSILPNKYTETVGPFVFLDHLLLLEHFPRKTLKRINKNRSHSLGDITTLTYFMNDESECPCSKDHLTYEGLGTQRMKKDNQVIQAELVANYSEQTSFFTHALQFCVSLPSKQRVRSQTYLRIESDEIPKQMLSRNRGWLKLVVGEYENLACKIQGYTKQFLYHFHLEPGKQISTTTVKGLDYAIFLPLHDAVINDIECNKGDVIEFDRQEGTIEIFNNAKVATDIIVFGGEKCI
jgi:redox-sensitive bicupin YhaK (pirin superfamily)